MPSRIALAFVSIIAIGLPFAAAAGGEDYLIGIATRLMIFALAGISLNLIVGYGGMVSFGHAAFFGIGAYVVAIMSQHALYGDPLLLWPVEISGSESALVVWPLAMAVAALFALVIGAICLRTGGLSFIMITLAFAQMIYFFFTSLSEYGGEDGLSLFQRSSAGPLDLADDTQFYFLTLALVILVLFLQSRLVVSRFGRVLQGIRDNESRMQALGYPTYRYKLTAFVISGSLAGLAGALIANQTEFVSPSFLDWHRSGEFLVIVILGGLGTLFGPVVGAGAYLLLEEFLSQVTEHWMLILGPILVLIVLFAKQGLWGSLSRRMGSHD
ncbi:MAG: branched-chain amino acid ABC transporter permease [Pseudomonadota bacterium]